jgi:hypothetical protein
MSIYHRYQAKSDSITFNISIYMARPEDPILHPSVTSSKENLFPCSSHISLVSVSLYSLDPIPTDTNWINILTTSRPDTSNICQEQVTCSLIPLIISMPNATLQLYFPLVHLISSRRLSLTLPTSPNNIHHAVNPLQNIHLLSSLNRRHCKSPLKPKSPEARKTIVYLCKLLLHLYH